MSFTQTLIAKYLKYSLQGSGVGLGISSYASAGFTPLFFDKGVKNSNAKNISGVFKDGVLEVLSGWQKCISLGVFTGAAPITLPAAFIYAKATKQENLVTDFVNNAIPSFSR